MRGRAPNRSSNSARRSRGRAAVRAAGIVSAPSHDAARVAGRGSGPRRARRRRRRAGRVRPTTERTGRPPATRRRRSGRIPRPPSGARHPARDRRRRAPRPGRCAARDHGRAGSAQRSDRNRQAPASLAAGHEPLGESDFQTVEAYGQHSLTPIETPASQLTAAIVAASPSHEARRSSRASVTAAGRVWKPCSAAADSPRATPRVAFTVADSSSAEGRANRAPVTNFQK